jgi:hypothetical protein
MSKPAKKAAKSAKSTTASKPVSQKKIDAFVALHAEADVTTRGDNPDCGVYTADGDDIPCHVVADYGETFVVLTLTGETREFDEEDLA